MGLAMVHGIVERHGGELRIESKLAQGTTVIIQLPSVGSPQRIVTKPLTEAPTKKLRVLVADDEPLVRRLLTEYLTGDQHTVESATNGREALEIFSQGTFDVVISDRGMPELNGDQLAAAIKKVAPDTPFIMLTGFGEMMQVSEEHPAGVDLVVGKPVTLSSLRQALARATSK